MTREEAINNLESLYNEVYNEDSDGYIYAEAIDIAIKALHDVIESQNNVIKKPKTVRYKLHKPIEYVSIEFDEEEIITHITHYNEVVRCKDCEYKCLYDERLYDEGDTKYYYCVLEDRPNRNWSVDDTDYCSWGERREE